MRTPPFKLTTTMESSGPVSGEDTLFQRVTVDEYSETATVHNDKAMAVGGGVMTAMSSMVERARNAS